MGQTKKKETEKEEVRSTVQQKTQVVSVDLDYDSQPPKPHDMAAAQEFWREEVESLRAMRFSTCEEARDAVVDRVLTRIGGDQQPSAELRDLLGEMLTSDPECIAILESLVGDP